MRCALHPKRLKADVRCEEKMMNTMTSRQLQGLFLAVEINLLTWLGVAFEIWRSNADLSAKHMAVFGCVLALGLQHWGYYNLYRRAKKQEEEKPPNQASESTPEPASGAASSAHQR